MSTLRIAATPKLCKDCKWIAGICFDLSLAKCTHVSAYSHRSEYLVTGNTLIRYCSSEREGDCGPDGKNWEPK